MPEWFCDHLGMDCRDWVILDASDICMIKTHGFQPFSSRCKTCEFRITHGEKLWLAAIPIATLLRYQEHMKLAGKLTPWLSSWAVEAWLAAALCLAAFAIMIFGGSSAAIPGDYSSPIWETLLSLLLVPIAIIVLLPFVAASQFVAFWLVRRSKGFATRLILLLISTAALIPYCRFVATADLTSTSTASLGAAFYPIYIAAFAVPLSLAVFWIGKLTGRRHAEGSPLR